MGLVCVKAFGSHVCPCLGPDWRPPGTQLSCGGAPGSSPSHQICHGLRSSISSISSNHNRHNTSVQENCRWCCGQSHPCSQQPVACLGTPLVNMSFSSCYTRSGGVLQGTALTVPGHDAGDGTHGDTNAAKPKVHCVVVEVVLLHLHTRNNKMGLMRQGRQRV
jgi:hypothetical protein